MAKTKKRSPTKRATTARQHSAAAPALLGLTSDWYWEQDAELRFTRVEVRNDAAAEQELARRILGKKRWETGVEIEGGWDAHRAMLEARAPFRDVLMWRNLPDGARRYISVSGEPMFDGRGRFSGYRGIGRDISKQKRIQQLLKLDHAVTLRLAEAHAAPEALSGALEAICDSLRWDCSALWAPDAAGSVLRHVAGWAAPGEPGARRYVEASKRPRIPPRRGPGRHGVAVGRADLGRRLHRRSARAAQAARRRDRPARRGAVSDPRRRPHRRGARVHLAAHAPARQPPVADAARHQHADRPVPRPRRGRARGARERSALARADAPFVRLVLGAGRGVPLHAARGAAGLRRRRAAAAPAHRPAPLGERPRGAGRLGRAPRRARGAPAVPRSPRVAHHVRRHHAPHDDQRRAAVQCRRQLRRLPRRGARRLRREACRADPAPRARGGAAARRRRGRRRRAEERDPRGVRKRSLRLRPLLPRRRRGAALPGRVGDRRAEDRALPRALAQLRLPSGRRPDRNGVALGRGGVVEPTSRATRACATAATGRAPACAAGSPSPWWPRAASSAC